MVVQRITLLKVSSADSIPTINAEYGKISSAIKDGKHYIISCKASETCDDQHSEGFNYAARTCFATLEDMNFYQNECSAHQALKTIVIPLVEGRMTVYWEE